MDREKEFEQLINQNIVAQQTLNRTPEPCSITENKQSVEEYSKVLDTNLASNYTMGLNLIYRMRNPVKTNMALDICCGPGLLTQYISTLLKYKRIDAIDLSKPMIDIAKSNIDYENLNIDFKVQSALNLEFYQDQFFDLVSFTNSAHHFSSIDEISKILNTADRITDEEGLIVLTDIGRLKNKEITDKFIELAGEEFLELNMPNMYQDFRNSMYAAWLPEELCSAIPKKTNRSWVQIVPKGFACYQAIIGLPKSASNDSFYLRDYSSKIENSVLRSEKSKNDFQILKYVVDNAEYRFCKVS